MLTEFGSVGSIVAAAFVLLAMGVASAHAILYKRDSRAAVAWVGMIWLAPLVGAILYLVFGINRIRRRALHLRGEHAPEFSAAGPPPPSDEELASTATLVGEDEPIATLDRLLGRATSRALVEGNRVEPLVNGDAAYPAMLAAIDAAEFSVSLSTYIFDHDAVGQRFQDALARAVKRGVEVRVLIDAVGARYSLVSMVGALERAGVPVAAFLPTRLPWRWPYMNLRNHRKILVVDGRVGFTGGLNVRAGHLLADAPRSPVRDLHFRLQGPVVAQMQETFAEDWEFATEERLVGEIWFPPLFRCDSVIARAIPDGPDESYDPLRLARLGALACAQSRVLIVTPYFLPDFGLITSLTVAALRGVEIEIVLPERSNLPWVDWASRAMWWQLLQRGCRIWLTPPPFDHAKLMVVDGSWALLGGSNWDSRSLRLNFELDVECHSTALVAELSAHVWERMAASRLVSLEEMDGRSIPVRLRDGIARLFTPIL